jgi:hypothetical protein
MCTVQHTLKTPQLRCQAASEAGIWPAFSVTAMLMADPAGCCTGQSSANIAKLLHCKVVQTLALSEHGASARAHAVLVGTWSLRAWLALPLTHVPGLITPLPAAIAKTRLVVSGSAGKEDVAEVVWIALVSSTETTGSFLGMFCIGII